MKYFAFILIITSFISCSKNQRNTIQYNTDYFEFNINYWVNLHHFMYQKADSSQLRKLQEDGLNFIEIGESNAELQMTNIEKEILNQSVKYYKDSLTTKNLRRDLNYLKMWLQKQDEFKSITDTTFGKKFTETINKVSPIYEKCFWKLHKSHNLSILTKHIGTIDEIEEEVINKMEKLSSNKWPDSTKVRVDVTAYANWAGAYTASKPTMNIVISTIDPSKITSSFVETILHEGSHLLYLYGKSPIRDKFYYKSEELGVEFPGNLWHASMFYLCGRATQNALSKRNIKHKMLMDVNNIFANYNSTNFKETNEKFFNAIIDENIMIIDLLNQIKGKVTSNEHKTD